MSTLTLRAGQGTPARDREDDAQLAAFFAKNKCGVVFGVGVQFTETATEDDTGTSIRRFYSLFLSNGDAMYGGAGHRRTLRDNYDVLVFSALRGSYLTGVIAAIHSASLGKSAVLLVSGGGEAHGRRDAFLSGLRATPEAAVEARVLAAVQPSSLAPEAYALKVQAAFDSALNGVDLVYVDTHGAVDDDSWQETYLDIILAHMRSKRAKQHALSFVLDPAVKVNTAVRQEYAKRGFTRSTLNITAVVAACLSSDWEAVLEDDHALPDFSTWSFTPNPQVNPYEYYGNGLQHPLNASFFDAFYLGLCARSESPVPLTRMDAIQRIDSLVPRSLSPERPLDEQSWRSGVAETVAQCLPDESVRLVGIGIYVNNVGDLDVAAGSVYIDAHIYVHAYAVGFASVTAAEAEKHPETGACSDRGFRENSWVHYTSTSASPAEFLNFVSMGVSRTIDAVYTEQGDLSYLRVQGTHYFQPQLAEWPFDTQNVQFVVEDFVQSSADDLGVVLCHDERYSGLAPHARHFGEPDEPEDVHHHALVDTQWFTASAYHCWPNLKYPYRYVTGQCGEEAEPVRWPAESLPNADLSCTCLGGVKASNRLVWGVRFLRPVFATIIMVFLPPVTILVVSEGAWLVRPESYTKRLSICGSGLISAVLFHASLSNKTPPTSQSTLADTFMLLVYVSILSAYIGIYAQSVLVQAGYTDLAFEFFLFSRIWGPLSTVLSLVLCLEGSGLMPPQHRMSCYLFVSVATRAVVGAVLWRLRDADTGFTKVFCGFDVTRFLRKAEAAAEVEGTGEGVRASAATCCTSVGRRRKKLLSGFMRLGGKAKTRARVDAVSEPRSGDELYDGDVHSTLPGAFSSSTTHRRVRTPGTAKRSNSNVVTALRVDTD